MEYVYIALVLLGAFVPAVIIVLKTNQSAKRGCGRGCATCGNREFCHCLLYTSPSPRDRG